MELVTGGELFERIANATTYSENEAKNVIRQTASALAHAHSLGIVHR
jgi:serine/threonine protein kinase